LTPRWERERERRERERKEREREREVPFSQLSSLSLSLSLSLCLFCILSLSLLPAEIPCTQQSGRMRVISLLLHTIPKLLQHYYYNYYNNTTTTILLQQCHNYKTVTATKEDFLFKAISFPFTAFPIFLLSKLK